MGGGGSVSPALHGPDYDTLSVWVGFSFGCAPLKDADYLDGMDS